MGIGSIFRFVRHVRHITGNFFSEYFRWVARTHATGVKKADVADDSDYIAGMCATRSRDHPLNVFSKTLDFRRSEEAALIPVVGGCAFDVVDPLGE